MNTENLINSPEHQAQVREAEYQLSREVPHLEKHLARIHSLQQQAADETKKLIEVIKENNEKTTKQH